MVGKFRWSPERLGEHRSNGGFILSLAVDPRTSDVVFVGALRHIDTY